VTENPVLRQALACARNKLPVLPCQPGTKVPATPRGYLDATTDPGQIRQWFAGHPDRNLALATGAPGFDVLDIDQHGEAGDGFTALRQLARAGLLAAACKRIRTPGGGAHYYFAGSWQRTAHLPAHHIDFLAQGGYVMVPPSQVGGRPYELTGILPGRGRLDWAAAVRVLDPSREHQPPSRQATEGHTRGEGGQTAEPDGQPAHRAAPEQRIEVLARWVGAQPAGNRNSGLFWAANRALEIDPAADLSPLAVAARQAGLDDPEIARTLGSARRTTQARIRMEIPDPQPEGAS